MREILFRGQTRRKGEKVRMDGTPVESNWVYGGIFQGQNMSVIYGYKPIEKHVVYSETVGEFTGAYEFVNGNPSIKGRIFEGDIVQVWSRRRPVGESYFSQKSTHDERCLVRAVVIFNKGEWQLDYNNKDNSSIAAARGNERCNRCVSNSPALFDWGHNRNRENLSRYMNLNPSRTVHDIQVIGNIFDNPELLEEETHHV